MFSKSRCRATVDKKGVVIHKAPTTCADPTKPGKKKMSTEIFAYTIKRHIRTADDVAGEIVQEKASPFKPKPQTKQVWGSLSEGPEKTVTRLAEAITQRLCWASELVCILDGEKSLWRLVYQNFPMAFFVLDIFHVLEYLSEVAHCFYKERSPEAPRDLCELD